MSSNTLDPEVRDLMKDFGRTCAENMKRKAQGEDWKPTVYTGGRVNWCTRCSKLDASQYDKGWMPDRAEPSSGLCHMHQSMERQERAAAKQRAEADGGGKKR